MLPASRCSRSPQNHIRGIGYYGHLVSKTVHIRFSFFFEVRRSAPFAMRVARALYVKN
jgi:hypothetical protein